MSVNTWADPRDRWRDEAGVVHVVGTYGNVRVHTDCAKLIATCPNIGHITHAADLFERTYDVVTCLLCWHDPTEFEPPDGR